MPPPAAKKKPAQAVEDSPAAIFMAEAREEDPGPPAPIPRMREAIALTDVRHVLLVGAPEVGHDFTTGERVHPVWLTIARRPDDYIRNQRNATRTFDPVVHFHARTQDGDLMDDLRERVVAAMRAEGSVIESTGTASLDPARAAEIVVEVADALGVAFFGRDEYWRRVAAMGEKLLAEQRARYGIG